MKFITSFQARTFFFFLEIHPKYFMSPCIFRLWKILHKNYLIWDYLVSFGVFANDHQVNAQEVQNKSSTSGMRKIIVEK